MSDPVCPTHNKVMKYNPKYGWTCTTKIGTDAAGQALWCRYKPGADAPSAPSPPRTTSIAPLPSTPSHAGKSWAWGVACDFAGRVYAGTGDAGCAEAIKMAEFVTKMISSD